MTRNGPIHGERSLLLMPDLEQSGIDPDETLPYYDGFPLLGPSSLDGPGTGTKDDGKDSQWGPATCHNLLAFPVVP
jgi:hypothetical protein